MTTESSVKPIDPAIERCLNARKRAFHRELEKGQLEIIAIKTAAEAYRAALPTLTSPDEISSFVACVTQGMILGVIGEKIGTKLLYAAQVAFSTRNRHPSAPKNVAA